MPQTDIALRYLARRERCKPDRQADAYQRRLLASLSGDVLEIGCGEGANFRRLPSTVRRLIAVEPRTVARVAAAEASIGARFPIEIREGIAEDLPVASASVDAVVSCCVLCSVESPARALSEVRRVLRPEGELRFYEHVRSDRRILAGLQRTLDATIWPALFGGCHTARDTRTAILEAGFTFNQCDSVFHSSHLLTCPAAPSILGIAS